MDAIKQTSIQDRRGMAFHEAPCAASESEKALHMIREATDGALDASGLLEAVAVLISQRDNARHYADTFREKLKELGHTYV